ncbi:F-box/LRR-repeat protein 14 isoform X2 [Peromyscus californicus insignis]|uniref:F-box/LRR-repeat protein 14 isoform X2 n=1 Tax=Peromyscus californicus insignis TaxID=564181 RepID=UPI0022A7A433|nr:F-box/LRR-repeat protein 14 isoform X2 [Peromyscus californicus insignis]
METHISCLFPELLAMIFGYLDVRDKGRAAQVCTAWRDAAYHKSVWRGVEAKLHLRRANPSLFPSLQARGIRRVQILSLRRSLSYVIQGMANIESLNLSGCYNLTDNGLGHAFVQEIGSLRALNLSLCKQITDSSLGRIAQYLKGLEVLELGGCSNITNTGLLLIAWGLQRLKSLNLRSCRHLSDVGIGHLAGMTRSAAEGCLGLEQLTLQDCQKLTDLSLKHISRGLTGLRLLNLSFCGGISDAGLLHLSHMGSLRSLNLRSCDNISDTGIMHLAMGSLRLSGLDVSFCDKVGDQSLAYIAQGLDGLKSLSLCSCHISDDGINRMVRQMHGLRTLNIGQCVRITDKGLELIAEHLSQLTGIDLYGCTRITKRGLERITQLPCLKPNNKLLMTAAASGGDGSHSPTQCTSTQLAAVAAAEGRGVSSQLFLPPCLCSTIMDSTPLKPLTYFIIMDMMPGAHRGKKSVAGRFPVSQPAGSQDKSPTRVPQVFSFGGFHWCTPNPEMFRNCVRRGLSLLLLSDFAL